MMEYPMESGLYLINGAAYLHIQEGIYQFDYTLYDKETMRQICHEQIDASLPLNRNLRRSPFPAISPPQNQKIVR